MNPLMDLTDSENYYGDKNQNIMKKFFSETRFHFGNFLAFCVVTACFIYFFWVSGASREENHNVGEIKTACISIITMILGYYYGSNKGSTKKDETIQQLSQNAATPGGHILTEEDLLKFPKFVEQGYKAGDSIAIPLYTETTKA